MNVVLPGIYGMGVTTCYTINREMLDLLDEAVTTPDDRYSPWIGGGFAFMVVISLLHVRYLWMPASLMSIIAWY